MHDLVPVRVHTEAVVGDRPGIVVDPGEDTAAGYIRRVPDPGLDLVPIAVVDAAVEVGKVMIHVGRDIVREGLGYIPAVVGTKFGAEVVGIAADVAAVVEGSTLLDLEGAALGSCTGPAGSS